MAAKAAIGLKGLIGPPLGPKFVVLIESAYIKSCIK